jgi:hypothetical protein
MFFSAFVKSTNVDAVMCNMYATKYSGTEVGTAPNGVNLDHKPLKLLKYWPENQPGAQM